MQRLLVSAALIAALSMAASAQAAGIEYPELGAVAVGRGGAVAARPEGGLSLMFNPAGMAWSKNLRIDADGKLMWNRVGFTATDPGVVANTAGAHSNNGHVFYGTPTNGSVLYGFGHVGPFENLAVGLGVMGPSATGKLNYPKDSSARYEKTDIDYFFAYYSVGVAARIGKAWGVGLTFQLAQGSAEFTQAVRGTSGEQTDTDIFATVDVQSGVMPTGVVGATFMPHEKVSLGLSYRPSLAYSGDGTLTSAFPPALDYAQPSQSGDRATLRLNFPHVVRFGAQYTPTSAWLVELNVVGEFWSVFDAARVVPHDITVTAAGATAQLQEIDFAKQYGDAVSVRLGADWQVLPRRLTIRAGYFYETSAIPNRTTSLDFPNWGRHGPGVGLSASLFGAQIHVAYAHHFVFSRDVTDSIIPVVFVPPLPPPKTIPTAGNGSYTSSSDMLVVGISVDLDKLSGDI